MSELTNEYTLAEPTAMQLAALTQQTDAPATSRRTAGGERAPKWNNVGREHYEFEYALPGGELISYHARKTNGTWRIFADDNTTQLWDTLRDNSRRAWQATRQWQKAGMPAEFESNVAFK